MSHPPSLQSGTLNVIPNLGFLSQIMSNLDQTFRIGLLATINIIHYVQLNMTLYFQSSVRNPQRPPSPIICFISQIMSNLHQTSRISAYSSTNMIHDVKDDPILHVFSQKPSTSSKAPT